MDHDQLDDEPNNNGHRVNRLTSSERSGLSFPELPRLQLEEMMLQVSDLAQNVLMAQGRLRALIRANSIVAGEIRLPVVLRQIVEAARELAGAKYAALGVIGHRGDLEQFIHVGMDESIAAKIGRLPRGEGVLGALITQSEVVRLDDLREHPAAVGFPEHHPPMGSFLGVPIRVGGNVFGNLYLTDSEDGSFTDEDEQLVVALASSAGIAIQNARLYEQSEKQRAWLSASADVTQRLFGRDAEDPLDVVLRSAALGADSDAASLVLAASDGQWAIRAGIGLTTDAISRQIIETELTLAGQVLRSGRPALVDDYANTFSDYGDGFPGQIGSVIGVPMIGRNQQILGALTVGRLHGRRAFTEDDVEQLVNFTNYVGIALELDRARADREDARTLEDHERIAADLHDHVIQELFATGMGIQSFAASLPHPDHQVKLLGFVDNLDRTIRQIRSTIFQLEARRSSPDTFQRQLLAILDEQSEALGFNPDVDFSGPLNLGITSHIADDVFAVVREALTNIAKHAHASSAHVRIALADQLISITVTDDGDGIGEPTRTSGLANIRHRADKNAGTAMFSTPDGGGTQLDWTARVSP
ncbi:two-component system sensor histidine kinase [soil metagenome]